MKKIAIFGGSFNPVHKGHIEMANFAIENLELDELIFVPCNKNPFKKDNYYVDGKHRIEMLKIAINNNKMKISDFEIKRTGPSYTIDTVNYFKNIYPNDELFLLIGSDNLNKISKWKDFDQILNKTKICIFKREKNFNKTNIKKFNLILLNNPLVDISSTNFINDFNWSILDDDVKKYISSHHLYFEKLLENKLSQKRFIHSVNSAKFAMQIALSLGFDFKKAYFAALNHDLAKEIDEQKSRNELKKLGYKNYDTIPKYKLHETLGALILKKICFVEEEDVIKAVSIHTSLDFQLSLLDKIVFVADKISIGRKFDGIWKLRKMAITDFDTCFCEVVKRTYYFNLEKGIAFNNEQEEIYQKWMKNKLE